MRSYFLNLRPKATDLPKVLEFLTKVLRRRSTVFVISDFLDSNADYAPMRKSMRIANQHHDLIAITLTDPREIDLPDCALVELMDAETGASMVIDTSNERLRKEYHTKAVEPSSKTAAVYSILSALTILIFQQMCLTPKLW